LQQQEQTDNLEHQDNPSSEIYYTNFTDEIIESKINEGDYSVNDMQSYKKKVNRYLMEHQDDLVVYKLKNNKPLTSNDIKHLEKILWHDLGTKKDYKKEFGEEPLLKLVSKIVGLDPKATNEIFSDFLSDKNLNINQMEFVKLIINYMIENGSMDKMILNEHPFNKCGNVTKLFNGKLDIAKKIIKEIKESKLKVQSQIQGEVVRVTAKNIDDLQTVITLLREKELDIPLQFINYRS